MIRICTTDRAVFRNQDRVTLHAPTGPDRGPFHERADGLLGPGDVTGQQGLGRLLRELGDHACVVQELTPCDERVLCFGGDESRS